MALVDPDFAEWLGRAELTAIATVAGADATWGGLAIDTRISSPLALKTDAIVEAGRQSAFRPCPLAVDRLLVPGQRVDLLGRVVTLTAEGGGYSAPVDVFVLAVDEGDEAGSTRLTVLRRMQ